MTRDVIYRGKILDLVKLEHRWEVALHAPAVSILALRGDEVLGVVQPRPAIGEDTWELPAGLIDQGETPEEAARRELAEETQLTGTFKLITQGYSSPGFTNEKIYLFEATGLEPAEGTSEEDEHLSVSWRRLEEVWDEIRSGKLASSAPTALGLAYALARKGRLT